MIKNFVHKGLENFFYDGERKGINPKHADKLERILEQLDAAEDIKYMTRIQKRHPLHPGVILQHHYVEPLSMSLTQLAEYLGVTEITVAEILNERSPVTADMALRLSKVFNTTPGLWMNLQKKYDLWHVAHRTTEWQKARPYEVSEMTIE